MRKRPIPFDKIWKSIVEEHIEDFLAFFLPDLHKQIDYSVEVKFLEQELQAVMVGKNLKKIDKLVQVQLKDGTQRLVFIHIEFEHSHKTVTKERAFDYYCRIKERNGSDITALVIYNGEHVPKNPSEYRKEVFGTTISYTLQHISNHRANRSGFVSQPQSVCGGRTSQFVRFANAKK